MAKRSPGAAAVPAPGAPASAQEKRQAGWLKRHPGANNPDSPNYDPLWRQHSRGHGAAEHKTRAEKAKAAGKRTSREQQLIRRMAARQSKRNGRDEAEIAAQYEAFRKAHGIAAVEEVNAKLNSWHRSDTRVRVRQRIKVNGKVIRVEIFGQGRSEHAAEMHDLAAKYGLDWDLLWYH